ncbi:hypothetical protein RJ639_040015 [Escallonia herrerae]|uniref:ADP-ribosyl cyclase/cyclic ADP-ribose hydrolase n=1 Tax=Escallonia herrerae TaxID=1293975 RepID=A0AA89AJ27_9ASTE|nr:hypothetical protein RJ639_019022 [Escallonia herrerae]KAK3028016.1 hypothetical protein RJ639_040015 [Escallonia herrerae]
MAPSAYHVFLSFRGPDTRKEFTGVLKKRLERAGYRTFMDEDDGVDKEINTRIETAIRDSNSAIVVFSANYASCPCCLDELVLIYERFTTSNYRIIPIFYTGVKTSHVRRQTHGYAEGLEGLQEKHSDKMGKWREALEKTSYLIGMHMEG